MAAGQRKRLVVVGLGMVGISFIEKVLKLDARAREYDIVVVGEEPHLAYNRVGLTSFFSHRKAENLYLNPREWYEGISDGALSYHLNTKATHIDTDRKAVACASGDEVPYDVLVLATGSDAVLPRHTPGHDARGVFVYRTIDDLERLIAFAQARAGPDAAGAVVGGGLLGLEAAKAMSDLGCYGGGVTVVERNGWVLSRQLDAEAGGMVVEAVRRLGLDVQLGRRVAAIETDGDDDNNNVTGVRFEDGGRLACSTVCFAIGVRARDELARRSGIRCADGGGGGGVVVGDDLRTSAPDVYAVGECASWHGQTFGLIAPGVEMADVLAFNLTQAALHQPRAFRRPDLSTKLKLMGVDVASFGDFFADRDGPKDLPAKAKRRQQGAEEPAAAAAAAAVKALVYKDPFQNVYKKYIFTVDGKYLLGGMMIGDTRDYVRLVPMVKGRKELEVAPGELILGAAKKGGDGADEGADLADDTQICSCHNVSKGDVVKAVKEGTCKSLGEVKSCTKAGTGCGGCVPLVTAIFNGAMRATGAEVRNNLCPHFPEHSRADLYHIAMVKGLRTMREVAREAGGNRDRNGGDAGDDDSFLGCEVCKPAVGSILSSLWNGHVVLDRRAHGLQDTNDRFLGNIQRDGTFSVVPRVAAGEITPDKLIAVGEVARRYGLYTKITGGQRIDMFGARKQDLPDIWRRLVAAGMESGHAYAKSLRTVKSCVGTTWCRYGVGDSVGLAVRLEERYKGVRAPHKIKGGVSGCVRECAEAQSKDFGLIATEKGWNVFVGGNGGAKPRHAQLLARDVAPAELVPLLDRYLMFYIRTADKLQRTARWIEALPGGLAYLREVIIDDRLGVCASLEAQMRELVDSFYDEWAEAVADPDSAAAADGLFRQFANTDEAVPSVEREPERGQERPAHWPRDEESQERDFAGLAARWSSAAWEPLLPAAHFAGADELPNGLSAAVKRGDTQLALWRVRGRYFAAQQMCPHRRVFALSDGLIGEDPPAREAGCSSSSNAKTSPYVSCPFHKRNYDLSTGACRSDSTLSIATFEAEERPDGMVYARLPPPDELDAALGTARWRVRSGEAGPSPFAELDRKIAFVGRRGKKPGARGATAAGAGAELGVGEAPMRRAVELMNGGGGGGCGIAPDW